MPKLLLKEYTNNTTNTKISGKDYFIEGIFIQSEIENRNGRIYPKEVLLREVAQYNDNFVKKNRAFGELDHPISDNNVGVELKNISHIITELKWDGNNVLGKAKIVDTPNGRIVKALLDAGGCVGVSTRGIGSLREENNKSIVDDDFQLQTIDIVADPSAPDAMVKCLREGKAWILENNRFVLRDLKNISSHKLNEAEHIIKKHKSIELFSEYLMKCLEGDK